ncbi:MAG: PBSX family phage terminase large subunit, partial [Ignavibacteria bacterium]|nr:PBSX family phage terminase large subunit [Ignavibacteria bacterium]
RFIFENNHKILLVRKIARTIRNSQFALLKSIIYDSGIGKEFRVKSSDLTIESRFNNNVIITAGVDDREKLKSINGITSVWIEEATELDKKDFLQIDLRLRNKTQNYKQILLTFNPVDANHWLNTTVLNDAKVVKTTYKDNPFLDGNYLKMIEGLKEQDSDYYDIYGLGNWGTLKNIIYKPFEITGNYPAEPDEVIYGLDFGYNNPTALVKVLIKDSVYYTDELIYETRLTNSELTERMKKIINSRSDCIYCDSSEPGRIQELRKAGFNVFPASKSVTDGIDFMKSVKIFSRNANVNINREVLSYSYKTDKAGNVLDEPVKFNDHCMDALRYAIYTHAKERKMYRIRFA